MLGDVGGQLPRPTLDDDDDSSKASGSNLWGDRGLKARLYEIDDRIRRNADFLELVVAQGREFMGGGDEGDAATPPPPQENGEEPPTTRSSPLPTPPADLDKVRTTLKQFVRDWSERGAQERAYAYEPILEALESHYPERAMRHQVRVLFPGCGLGRLPWEAAMRVRSSARPGYPPCRLLTLPSRPSRQGFSSQGNEFSLYMLLASHLILNKTTSANSHRIYPWVHTMSNWRRSDDVLEEICVPDVDPAQLLADQSPEGDGATSRPEFSMSAGDFLQVYSAPSERGAWDVICTCFFLDTARNPISYLEVIHSCLKPNGIWINLGPLLWHFEGSGPEKREDGEVVEGSIELTLEEVLGVMMGVGFVVEERRTLQRQGYTGNGRSMLSYEYECEFWVARKSSSSSSGSDGG